MIDWNKYFEHIYIYSCTSNFERREKLDKELQRIGCNNYKYYYSPKDNQLMNYEHFHNHMARSHKNITFGEYTLIKTCYELGYNNILLIEDDLRFLKDINEIETQLNIFLENRDKCNFYFFDYVIFNYCIFNFSCVYLDRKGMEYIIYCIENFPLVIDNYFHINYLYPNNCTSMNYNYTYYYSDNECYQCDINIGNNVLPIQVMVAPKRLCIQEDVQTSYLEKQQDDQYQLNNIEEYNL